MLRYYLKEIWYNIKNKFGVFIINLTSIYIATILLAASVILYFITYEIEKDVKSKFVINVFLQDSIGLETINKNLQLLQSDSRIRKIIYVSKEEAIDKFKKETGEDFTNILEDINPLPASFEIFVKDEYINNANISDIKNKISTLEGVEDIKYESELVSTTIQKLFSVNMYLFWAAISFILIAFFILYSNAKMLILYKVEELEILKLLGAKLSTIRRVFIYYYLFIGFIATLFILATIFLIYYFVQNNIYNINYYVVAHIDKIIAVVLLPIVLSWMISFIVTRSIDLKIRKFE